MATSKVEIISLALLQLGHSSIISLENGDPMTVAAEQAYNLLLRATIANNNWRWAATITQLSKLAEAPPHPWKAAYNLPADWIKTIRVIPNNYAWDIYANSKIYAQFDGGDFYMEYLFQPEATLLPADFVLYFTYEIAAYLALSNAQLMSYYDRIEQKRKEQFAICAGGEAQNRPQFFQKNFPVINNRNLTTVISNTISS